MGKPSNMIYTVLIGAIFTVISLSAAWNEVTQNPQPNDSLITKIHDFTIGYETRYLLADEDAPASFINRLWQRQQRVITKNLLFTWDSTKKNWTKIAQQPPFKPHVIHCTGTTLYAIAYDDVSNPTQTKIMLFADERWTTLQTTDPYTIKEWGKSVAIAGNNPESIWITFKDPATGEHSTTNLRVEDSTFTRTLKMYPYHSVSIGIDNSFWALDSATDTLIKPKEVMEPGTKRLRTIENDIMLSSAMRKSDDTPLIQKLYALDKNTCYGLKNFMSDKVYLWNNTEYTFSPIKGVGVDTIVALGLTSTSLFAIRKDGVQFWTPHPIQEQTSTLSAEQQQAQQLLFADVRRKRPELKHVESDERKHGYTPKDVYRRDINRRKALTWEPVFLRKPLLSEVETFKQKKLKIVPEPHIQREHTIRKLLHESRERNKKPLIPQPLLSQIETFNLRTQLKGAGTYGNEFRSYLNTNYWRSEYVKEKAREKEQKEHPEKWALQPYTAPTPQPLSEQKTSQKKSTSPSFASYSKRTPQQLALLQVINKYLPKIINDYLKHLPDWFTQWLGIKPVATRTIKPIQ
jgi:hypothetical protein